MLLVFSMLALVSLGGCVFSSSPVTTKMLRPGIHGPKVVAVLNQTPYFVEMSEALGDHGFVVKAAPTQQYVTEADRPGRIRQYDQASTRYGITLTAERTGACALTEYGIYRFTLTLMDLQDNEVVAVFRQKGSDGPCTTVKPVFDTLAAALAAAW
jgi:hypothetical protein